MKFMKLSLIAAMLIGSSVFAIENTKVSGNAKLYYGTTDSNNGNSNYRGVKTSLFDSAGSYVDAAVNLEVTTDLTKGVSAGVKGTYISTLGLENNLVDNTWSNTHSIQGNSAASFAGGAQLNDEFFLGEAWIAGTALDTTVKVGRQALDTPLAFTETWGIDANTFEAIVLINQSIPDTTIVATYIGKSNGSADDVDSNGQKTGKGTLDALTGASQAGYVAKGGAFNTFGANGVYVAGIINNSIKPLTLQAWYYNMQQLATAYWLQADLNMGGILAGAQYVNTDLSNNNPYNLPQIDSTDAYAFMLGYDLKDVVVVKVAYSSVSDKGTLGVANTATGNAGTPTLGGGQSKLYTEMNWSYGYVSAVGADSYSITADTTLMGVDVLAGFYNADIDAKGALGISKNEMTEFSITASKSYGPLDSSVALIFDDYNDKLISANDVRFTSLQVYLTYNF